jgi:hypothetical protein
MVLSERPDRATNVPRLSSAATPPDKAIARVGASAGTSIAAAESIAAWSIATFSRAKTLTEEHLMEGTIEQSGNTYWWWAGPANEGAAEGYCIHCRGDTYGVTQYVDAEPSEAQARSTAEALIPKVQQIR